jgi:hypothetical protein
MIGTRDYHQLRSEEEINSKGEELIKISCQEKSTGSQGQHTTSNAHIFFLFVLEISDQVGVAD